MAVVIEFYIPKHFRRKVTLGRSERGKLIAFALLGYALTDERSDDDDFSIQQFDRSDIDLGDGKVVASANLGNVHDADLSLHSDCSVEFGLHLLK